MALIEEAECDIPEVVIFFIVTFTPHLNVKYLQPPGNLN